MKKYMLMGVALLAGSIECTRPRYNGDDQDVMDRKDEKQERKKQKQREQEGKPVHIVGSKASQDEERKWRKDERRARHDQTRREAGYHSEERDRREADSRWHTGYQAGHRTPGHSAQIVEGARRGSENHPNSGRYQQRFHSNN